MSVADLRREYRRAGLDEALVDLDPFRQFGTWFTEAQAAGIEEPNAMTLATASPDGMPSARTVLLKGFDERGFAFYSNYESHKGRDLLDNPRAALLFYWKELERQVRLTGLIERMSREETEGYFRTRPIGSQIGALVSRQSQVVPSRAALEDEFARLEAEYAGKTVPLPDYWGGFRLSPTSFEFWQGRPNRLHDRLRYRPDEGGWRIERLSP